MQHAMVANDGARSRVGMAFSTVFADASGNIGHSHGNFIAVVEACAPFTIRANGPEWRVHSTKRKLVRFSGLFSSACLFMSFGGFRCPQ